MEYRKLNGSGLFVPALTLGTGTFGGSHGFENWGHAGVSEATRMVDMCLNAGLNMFDTADMYSQGLAEEILGKAETWKVHHVSISSRLARQVCIVLAQTISTFIIFMDLTGIPQ